MICGVSLMLGLFVVDNTYCFVCFKSAMVEFVAIDRLFFFVVNLMV